MKKLYRKGTVHPTQSVVSDQLLSFLPAAILALTVGLSPEDREVLAYLISCSGSYSNTQRKADQKAAVAGGSKGGGDHPPCFGCNCFRCYMSYWAKWNSSPNRQLIDEIIDAFEDSLLKESKKEKSKKERRKGKSVKGDAGLVLDAPKKSEPCLTKEELNFGESSTAVDGGCDTGGGGGGSVDGIGEEDIVAEGLEKGSVRRIMSFFAERIFKLWG